MKRIMRNYFRRVVDSYKEVFDFAQAAYWFTRWAKTMKDFEK